jgi:hypothetical protein
MDADRDNEQLSEDPELLQAAGAVALLALENAELGRAPIHKRATPALAKLAEHGLEPAHRRNGRREATAYTRS